MTRYEPHRAQEVAERLDREAETTPLVHAIIGGILGAAALALVMGSDPHRIYAILGGLAAGLVLGLAMGRQKAMVLQAHVYALACQMQIERNTRKEKAAAAEPATASSASRREHPTMQKAVLSRPTSGGSTLREAIS